MAINGLTDNREAFPIIGVLRKGEAKDPNKNSPGKDLTYFRFVTDDKLAEDMFHAAYPDQEALRNINIFLPCKTTQENFIDGTWIEKWVASSLVYRSDGDTVVLWKTAKGAFSTEPKPDPKPEVLEDGKRADGSMQVGRLSAIIPELGRFVTVTILTTSKWDIINLSRQLRSVESLKGDLRGIPFVIRRRQESISTPAGNGKRARREKWLLSIEMKPEYAMAQLTAQERAALPEGANIVIDTDDYILHELPSGLISPIEDAPEVKAATDPAPAPAPKAKAPNAQPNGNIPRKPQDLLDTINRRIEATYDGLPHLLNSIKKELGDPDWKWPAFKDEAGWQVAYNAAYKHAVAKTQAGQAEAPGAAEMADLLDETDQLDMFDGELDEAAHEAGAEYRD